MTIGEEKENEKEHPKKTVPETETGTQVENTKGNEKIIVKELGKITS